MKGTKMVVVAAVALAACSGGSDDTADVTTGEPTADGTDVADEVGGSTAADESAVGDETTETTMPEATGPADTVTPTIPIESAEPWLSRPAARRWGRCAMRARPESMSRRARCQAARRWLPHG